MDKKKTYIDYHIDDIEHFGFWDEIPKSSLIHQLEGRYSVEHLTKYGISEIIINDKVIFKWYKRLIPLTLEEVKDKYGL